MNGLDVVLILLALLYALTGYRQGFLVGSCSTLGLIAGGFVGIQIAPVLLSRFDASLTVSTAAIVIVLAVAFVGQAVGAAVGRRLRGVVVWRPARFLDALSGAALSVAAMLVIAWVLGVAASGSRLDGVNAEVRGSRVLGAVNEAMPGGSQRLISAFSSVVDSSGFPRYLEPFATEHITQVRPPNAAVVHGPSVTAAGASVVKVLGDAPSCSKTFEGSGFVYAANRVLTNAHVVAGVEHPVVRLEDTDYRASVVVYDPERDVAVLAVPGLSARPLRLAERTAGTGDPAAVLGFPEDGPFDAEPGRIRSVEHLRSPDIYGNASVVREVYAVYAKVRQGNSGGPLLAPDGKVLGLVFAASLVDDHTGYALTADEVRPVARAGRLAGSPVDTGGCAL